MVLFETRGLWLSSIVQGGIGWRRRLACVSSTGLAFPIDTSPRIERLKKPMTTARNGSQGWHGLSTTNAQAACDFNSLASKRTSFFQITRVIAAIFLAKVRRAIVGRLPLASKAS
jgi:hypothetical protein